MKKLLLITLLLYLYVAHADISQFMSLSGAPDGATTNSSLDLHDCDGNAECFAAYNTNDRSVTGYDDDSFLKILPPIHPSIR